jgi:hypothetical protein
MSGLNSLPERFVRHIEPEPMSGCWLWTGSTNRTGYGLTWDSAPKRTVIAHRFIYELLVGPIVKPTLDHKCRVRCCVNPSHVKPATSRENIFAPGSACIAKAHAEKTHCDRGHRLSTYANQRKCKPCHTEYTRWWRAKRGGIVGTAATWSEHR